MSNKLIVTYKRKRAPSQSHLSNGTFTDSLSKASGGDPKAEVIIAEKLNEEILPSIRANEGNFNESMHQAANKDGIEKCTNGTHEGSVEIFDSNTSSSIKESCSERSSGIKKKDVDTAGRSDQAQESPGCERKCCHEKDCVSARPRTLGRHTELANDEPWKGVRFNPVITFSRRVKKKLDVGETRFRSPSKAEDKLQSELNRTRANHEYEVSVRSCNLSNPSSKAPLVLEQANCDIPHVLQSDQDSTDVKDSELGFKPAEFVVGPKNSTTQTSNFGHQNQAPQPAEKVPEAISDKFVSAPTGESALAHESTTVREELGSKIADENDLDQLTTPDNVPEKREKHSKKRQSIDLPSYSCFANSNSCKSSIEMVQKDPIEPYGLTKSCSIVVVDEETDGRDRELEWLETLDKALQERQKNACLITKEISLKGTEMSNRKLSDAFPMNLCIRSLHNQERVFLTNECDTAEKLQHEETTTMRSYQTDFLGVSEALNSEGASSSTRFSPSMSLPQSFSVQAAGLQENNTELRRNLSLGNPALRRKLVIDNSLSDTPMLERIDASSNHRFLDHWSEEELDSLWIGVRRHGLNNWNAILKDPRLCFSNLRVAEDLAEQWGIEQRELLNGTLFQPPKVPILDVPPFADGSLVPRSAITSHYYGNGARSVCREFPTQTRDTELSLGHLYLQKDSNFKRSLHHSLESRASDLLGKENLFSTSFLSSFPASSSYERTRIGHQNAFKAQITSQHCSSSWVRDSMERVGHEQPPSTQLANNELPHWPRNVLGKLISCKGSELMSSVSLLDNNQQIAASASNLQKPPALTKESRKRGILKRRNARAFYCSISEQWMGLDQSVTCQNPEPGSMGHGARVGLDLNKGTATVDPSDVVVIVSDASSEETISDDRSL